MKNQLKFLALAAALTAGSVYAQTAGTWMARAGVAKLTPANPSENLSAPSLYIVGTNTGTQVNTGEASQIAGGITYMVTDNVSVDLPLALPFKHALYGAGATEGVGQIGEVQALPVTLFLQYRFMEAAAKVRPYVGLGVTYAYFFNEQGSGTLTRLTGGTPSNPTKLTVESKFTVTPEIGVTVAIDEKWFVDMFYSKAKLTTQSRLSTGQTVNAALDPTFVGVSVGYKF